MRKRGGSLCIVGIFGFSAAAIAQTPPAMPPVTKYDGTYAFVSSAKVNETYSTRGTEHIGRCADRIAGPLTIVNGEARYSGSGRMISREFEGTVSSQGELAMRANAPAAFGMVEITLYGRIDGNGKVTARQSGVSYSYNFVWKESK